MYDVDEVIARIAEINKRIGEHKTNIATLDKAIAKHEATIAEIDKKLAEMEARKHGRTV